MANSQKPSAAPAPAATSPDPELHKYHIVLANTDERDVSAASIKVEGGNLLLLDNERDILVVYAPGAWAMVEVERKDDRG